VQSTCPAYPRQDIAERPIVRQASWQQVGIRFRTPPTAAGGIPMMSHAFSALVGSVPRVVIPWMGGLRGNTEPQKSPCATMKALSRTARLHRLSSGNSATNPPFPSVQVQPINALDVVPSNRHFGKNAATHPSCRSRNGHRVWCIDDSELDMSGVRFGTRVGGSKIFSQDSVAQMSSSLARANGINQLTQRNP